VTVGLAASTRGDAGREINARLSSAEEIASDLIGSLLIYGTEGALRAAEQLREGIQRAKGLTIAALDAMDRDGVLECSLRDPRPSHPGDDE
jgi:hypothetical protein